MLFSIGSVSNYVKSLDLKQKWEKRKQDPLSTKDNASSSTGRSSSVVDQMLQQNDYSADLITQRMNAGKKLTSGELTYLRENYPDLYKKAVRISREREEYERQLKQCKTKEEVRQLRMQRSQSFVSEIRDAAGRNDREACEEINARANNIGDEHVIFTDGKHYKALPNDENERARQKKEKRGNKDASCDEPQKDEIPYSYFNRIQDAKKPDGSSRAAATAEEIPEDTGDAQQQEGLIEMLPVASVQGIPVSYASQAIFSEVEAGTPDIPANPAISVRA